MAHAPTTAERPAAPLTLHGQSVEGVDRCVHCGLCLAYCPTFSELATEMDSPRGRILLIKSLAEGRIALTDSVTAHLDQCLGCRACEPVCPSGVPYGQLLEATRATLNDYQPMPFIARLILFVFAREWLLRPAMFFSRLLAATPIPTLLSGIKGRLGFAMAMLASTGRSIERSSYDPATRGERGTVAILRGCVMDGLFRSTNRATERVLKVNGYASTAANGQRCCGALHAHAGDLEGARALARKNIAAFERSGAQYIVANAAGCGA